MCYCAVGIYSTFILIKQSPEIKLTWKTDRTAMLPLEVLLDIVTTHLIYCVFLFPNQIGTVGVSDKIEPQVMQI